MLATLLALLSALPELLKLANLVAAQMRERELRGLGRKEALAEALEQAHRDLALADAAQIEAETAHAKDPTDGAFDRDFERVGP